MDFAELMERATGRLGQSPYAWQQRVADEGLPELISVETGAGKTEGVVLPWLWRRRFHPDSQIRAATPHWLVLCLPLRTLTEQTERLVARWLAALGVLSEDDQPGVRVHVAMGGRQDGKGDLWRRHPDDDAVVIGTVDMLLSRALNRGYALSRFSWPIDFGLLSNGCHWVYDEVQLLGPALATGRQLDALRRRWGTALPSASTWMSATVDEEAMSTVDHPHVSNVVSLGPSDRQGPLRPRLDATRRVSQLAIDPKRYTTELAEATVRLHRPGSLTVVIVNTVPSARELFAAVGKRAGATPCVLLHSRFRPLDRAAAMKRAITDEVPPEGRIVVSTQVLEAGVDLSSTTLITEAAPWPSIVQRAGRCNRDGQAKDARLLWVRPPRFYPYDEADVGRAMAALEELEGQEVTATSLRDRRVETSRPVVPVLRATDMLGLFDTAPDLSGNDVDVAPFIRAGDDLDIYLAWRDIGAQAPSPGDRKPSVVELCPIPAGKEAKDLAARTALWRFNHIDGAWDRVNANDIRPGLVVIADSHAGGYQPEMGWDPSWRVPVPRVPVDDGRALEDVEDAIGDDDASFNQSSVWVSLTRHLGDVEAEAARLLTALDPIGITESDRKAVVAAGRLHDIGKAHDVFQDTMARSADEARRGRVEAGGPWAKSGGSRRARHHPPYFRHELASALALLDAGSVALAGVDDPHLVVYLVAAHHGRVRMAIRSVPKEERLGTTLGIRRDGDVLPAVRLPQGDELPASRLSLELMGFGRASEGHRSWTERALDLRDRAGLGPFRLAFLEALVRMADWRASDAEAREEGDL